MLYFFQRHLLHHALRRVGLYARGSLTVCRRRFILGSDSIIEILYILMVSVNGGHTLLGYINQTVPDPACEHVHQ